MLVNYNDDPSLFERCINLMNGIFPGIKKVAVAGIKYNARWDRISIPFIKEVNGQVIAHLGLIPFEVVLNHKPCRIAALHGICVHEDYRGRGYFKKLMVEALGYVQNNFDAAVLFTNKSHLYTAYNFYALPEYDFVVNANIFEKKSSDLQLLNLANEDDLLIIDNLLNNHLTVSDQFGFINEKFIFILDHLSRNIYFSPSLNILLSYEVIDQTLYLRYIASQKQYALYEILALISQSFNKVILQFCPDKFVDYSYTPILANPADGIMVSESFKFKDDYFRYPDPYRC